MKGLGEVISGMKTGQIKSKYSVYLHEILGEQIYTIQI